MMKLIVIICAFVAGVVFAEEGQKPIETARLSPKEAFELRKRTMIDKQLGGRFEKPGTQKGVIYVVNAQRRVADSTVARCVAALKFSTNFDIRVKTGRFDFPSPGVEGEASLFLVDDEKYPMTLFAPEARWVMVNVFPLATGRGSEESFLAARVKKMISRGFCMLGGAQDSQFRKTVVGAITKPEQIDDITNASIPFDVLRRMSTYLDCYGVAPAELIPYAQACQEGWGPAPTNERQRVIWERVHALPKNPIKIEKTK